MNSGIAMRTDERVNEHVRAVIRQLTRTGSLPVVFGGAVSPKANDVRIDFVAGGVTSALVGLRISAGSGLGGRVVVTARPHYVPDYLSDSRISHEYDGPVAAEGLRAIAAVPLVVNDAVLAVIYAGVRGSSPLGGRVLDVLQRAVVRAGIDLAVHVELERRYAEFENQVVRTSAQVMDARSRNFRYLREVYEELRVLTQEIDDVGLRERFAVACERLGGNSHIDPHVVPLSPRELEVVDLIADGCSNKEAGNRMGLTTETVKSYLRSASRKLGTHNRTETVSFARRAGLVP